MKHSKGDLVKWYMIYDVGIAKDAGIGIIIDCYKYDMFEEPCYTYKVFRNEHNDTMIFGETEIQKFKGENNEIK